MKRFARTLILAALMCCTCTVSAGAHTFESMYLKYSSEEGCVSLKMGRFLIGLARLAGTWSSDGSPEMAAAMNMLGDINRIEVLDMSECGRKVQEKFRKDIDTIETDEYVNLMQVRERDGNVSVFAKMNSGTIRELVIAVTGDESVLLRIKGHITPESVIRFIRHI